MQILKVQALRGPNIWSNYRKNLIQMRLDLEDMENYPTDKIPGFRERIEKLLPSMIEHRCSESVRGGFFTRVENGTWMGHVIEHIALEIQNLAGMETGYGRTRSTRDNGVYNVVFSFIDEEAGRYAAEAAVRIAEALIKDETYDLDGDIDSLRKIYEQNRPGTLVQNLIDEAKKRDIPRMQFNDLSYVQLGYGKKQVRLPYTYSEADTDIFSVDKPARIPIIAITGTNGKTTTTRLLAHIIKNSGYTTGFTTSDGIYIDNLLQERGDTTGPISARDVLGNSKVDFAILETARGGILRSGLGFDKCDIGIITNIKEDHLGLNDVHTLADLAKVKGVVANSVRDEGWAVLNGDDKHCIKIATDLDCNIAFFSIDNENVLIGKFMAEGKTVATVQDGMITIQNGNAKVEIEQLVNVPLTMDGKLQFMIANVLAATLAAYVQGIEVSIIRKSLRSFSSSYENTPGRMNIFEFNSFKILVDYAHNPHGVAAVKEYVNTIPANRKIGIISGVGDRRDDDIRECARISAQMCDHIIIRKKKDMRGRVQENVTTLLVEGIRASGKNITYEVVLEERDAIKHAMAIAEEGDFIIALTDEVPEIVAIIKDYQERDKNGNEVRRIRQMDRN